MSEALGKSAGNEPHQNRSNILLCSSTTVSWKISLQTFMEKIHNIDYFYKTFPHKELLICHKRSDRSVYVKQNTTLLRDDVQPLKVKQEGHWS